MLREELLKEPGHLWNCDRQIQWQKLKQLFTWLNLKCMRWD